MQIVLTPLQLIGLRQLPLLSACPEKWLQLQYRRSCAKLPVVIVPSPLPWVPVATAFLTPAVAPGSSRTDLLAEAEDELGPGTGSTEGLSLWGWEQWGDWEDDCMLV